MNLVGILLFLFPAIAIFVVYQFHIITAGKAFFFNRIIWGTEIGRSRYVEVDAVLMKRISFYKKLSDNGKAKFVHRLCKLLLIKEFEPKNELVLTEEIKITVCASIVQLTFGLFSYELDNIKGFKLYPSVFYSSFLKAKLRGSTPPEGLISLSWRHLEHGFLIDNDKYNLGLHEVAHALKLSLKYAYDYDAKYASYVKEWEKFGHVEFLKMKRGKESFLRKYGGVNEHEFFAVCVEHFFEVPEQFQERLPKIYYHLCILLNLNPLNDKRDYYMVK